jgi:hypothetical protein
MQINEPLQGNIDDNSCTQRPCVNSGGDCGGDLVDTKPLGQSGSLTSGTAPEATKCETEAVDNRDGTISVGGSKVGPLAPLPTGAVDSRFDAASALAALAKIR